MSIHADKTQEQRIQSVSNAVSRKRNGGESSFQFVDNRPESVAQRKIQEMANSSPKVRQLKAFHEIANNSPGARQAAQLQAVIQRQCDHCGNPVCDDGSICNYDGSSYAIGQHGARRSEQRRLRDEHGQDVSGDTHQSEHYFGFEPLNRTSGQSRRQAGRFEREAPAYQEVLGPHRAHVGTGTSSTAGPSGLSADTYRDAQRALLESGDVSAAGQLNTLGYAHQPGFSESAQTIEGQQASDSFTAMIGRMVEVTYMQGETPMAVPVSDQDQLEQLAARIAVERGHDWVTDEDVAEARIALGM